MISLYSAASRQVLRPIQPLIHGNKDSLPSRFNVKNGAFYVLITVVMKSPISWAITPCNSLKFNRCFVRICRLHLQGRRISQARNRRESRKKSYSKMQAKYSSETLVDFSKKYKAFVTRKTQLFRNRFIPPLLHPSLWSGDSLITQRDNFTFTFNYFKKPLRIPTLYVRTFLGSFCLFNGFSEIPQLNSFPSQISF
jgi:hypothetical protein